MTEAKAAPPPLVRPTRKQCQLGFLVVIAGYLASVMFISMCDAMDRFLFRYPRTATSPILETSQVLLAVSGAHAQTILLVVWAGISVLYIAWIRRTVLRMLRFNAGLGLVLVFLLGFASVATKKQVEATRQWRLNQKNGRTMPLPPAG